MITTLVLTLALTSQWNDTVKRHSQTEVRRVSELVFGVLYLVTVKLSDDNQLGGFEFTYRLWE